MSEVNFLPASYIRRRALQRRGRRRSMAIFFAAIGLIGWFFMQRAQTASLRSYVERIEATAADARERQTELNRLRSEHATLVKSVSLQRELGQPVSHTQVLATLGQALPATVTFSDVALTTQRPAPAPKPSPDQPKQASRKGKARAGTEPDRITIDLVGRAPDDETVANAIAKLDRHPLFEAVMLRYSRATHTEDLERSGREFRLTTVVRLDRRYVPAPWPTEGGVADAR